MAPYHDAATMSLPFASGSETSRAGAVAAVPNAGRQRDVMAAYYNHRGPSGLTDAEMSERTGYPVNVVCARRSDLKCVPCGKRDGGKGVMVTAWTLPDTSDDDEATS